jgi:transcriptional regulator with XRE-family HTH domain
MKDRIQKFIDYKSISPGSLAEILEVQRSNISHILNGRNKPGAIFIEKLLLAFPMLNARWLFTGEGPMVVDKSEPARNVIENAPEPAKEADVPAVNVEEPYKVTPVDAREKSISKVVLLYSDGTFSSYNPLHTK